MTVWIVNPFDNLPTEGNRPQRYWLMAEAFARAGCRAVYWTSDFSHATKQKRRCRFDRSPRPPFEVVQIPTLPYATNVCWARVRSHARLAKTFAAMAHSRLSDTTEVPDVVIASTPPLGLCQSAMRVARDVGARFVCDVQDAWPETFERLLPTGCKGLHRLLLAPMYATARRIYRSADGVTGVSARYARLTGRKDFYLAYHGIEAAANAAHEVRPTKNGAPSTVSLVYAGNLGQGYDLETVVEAIARRPNWTLDIAGLGPREASVRSRVAAGRLTDRVRFHGYLGAEDLNALLAHCDVGVIPMRDDSWVGLPYKLGDYLRAGLRVVSSLHGECGELILRKGLGQTYAFGNPDDLLRAVDALPPPPVELPDELRADRIYPAYVKHVMDL